MHKLFDRVWKRLDLKWGVYTMQLKQINATVFSMAKIKMSVEFAADNK